LLYTYYKTVPDDPVLKDPEVLTAASLMIDLWKTEQNHEKDVALEGNAYLTEITLFLPSAFLSRILSVTHHFMLKFGSEI
jgi:hypothetical protein